jgi:hypothetical protein
MSVNRGLYQGQNVLSKLATTYQTEMASRLLLTIAAIYLLPVCLAPSLWLRASVVLCLWRFSFQSNFRGCKNSRNT